MNKCFKKADILLPDPKYTSAYRWSVIACDQFTSEPQYWQDVKREVGASPSTFNTILPEVYLSEAKERIPKINAVMKTYLDGVLKEYPDSAIFVERTQSNGKVRRGVVLAVDLECYDFNKGAQSLIRATEATVLERIPPRVAIRRDASIELPHVMLLIDDPYCTVIEPLTDECDGALAYDTDLMLGGGHITGRFLSERNFHELSNALLSLATPEQMKARYGTDGLSPLLFAVGDGNHSLATAKTAYEEIKARLGEDVARSHPARYALAEIVNIHDPALEFEPIYRVMFGVEPYDVIAELNKYASTLNGDAKAQRIDYTCKNVSGAINIEHPVRQLTVGTLGDFIDAYVSNHSDVTVDYIHGVESVNALSSIEGCLGFIFGGMEKSELFKTVIFDGSLPRKTFSMGDARDKRYYMEARKIVKEV